MAGKRDELAALRERVGQLEQEVQRLRGETAMARSLLDDARQLADWTDEARRLRESTAAAADTIRALTTAAGIGRPRFRARLNKIYHAETAGYVSLFFVGGRTGTLEILVGASTPPTESVAESNTRNDLNSYAGTIVRAGEYWTVTAKHDTAGYICMFTPLY